MFVIYNTFLQYNWDLFIVPKHHNSLWSNQFCRYFSRNSAEIIDKADTDNGFPLAVPIFATISAEFHGVVYPLLSWACPT